MSIEQRHLCPKHGCPRLHLEGDLTVCLVEYVEEAFHNQIIKDIVPFNYNRRLDLVFTNGRILPVNQMVLRNTGVNVPLCDQSVSIEEIMQRTIGLYIRGVIYYDENDYSLPFLKVLYRGNGAISSAWSVSLPGILVPFLEDDYDEVPD